MRPLHGLRKRLEEGASLALGRTYCRRKLRKFWGMHPCGPQLTALPPLAVGGCGFFLLFSQSRASKRRGGGAQQWVRRTVNEKGKWLPLLTQKSSSSCSQERQRSNVIVPRSYLTDRIIWWAKQTGLFKNVFRRWASQEEIFSIRISPGSLSSFHFAAGRSHCSIFFVKE